MLLVFLVLFAVAAAALFASNERPSTTSSPSSQRPSAAGRTTSAASRPRPSTQRGGRRYCTADDLPAPGQEPPTFRKSYRAGGFDFSFSFERQADGRWRAYIERGMPYGRRGSGLHVTHRLKSGSRHYVCFTPEPTSLRAMAKVAAYWADMTAVYVRTGRTIDEQVASGQRATA